jgi:hypothetical protein
MDHFSKLTIINSVKKMKKANSIMLAICGLPEIGFHVHQHDVMQVIIGNDCHDGHDIIILAKLTLEAVMP